MQRICLSLYWYQWVSALDSRLFEKKKVFLSDQFSLSNFIFSDCEGNLPSDIFTYQADNIKPLYFYQTAISLHAYEQYTKTF